MSQLGVRVGKSGFWQPQIWGLVPCKGAGMVGWGMLATGRLGGGRQEVVAPLCIRERRKLGPNPNSLHFSGSVQAAQLSSVLGSPPQMLGRVLI